VVGVFVRIRNHALKRGKGGKKKARKKEKQGNDFRLLKRRKPREKGKGKGSENEKKKTWCVKLRKEKALFPTREREGEGNLIAVAPVLGEVTPGGGEGNVKRKI